MDKLEEILLWHHLDEMARKRADSWNIGWYESPTVIESKTSKGVLHTEIVPRTKKVRHHWFRMTKPVVKQQTHRNP